MLVIGVQFIIWSVSGAYMVITDINYIHGNSLVKNQQVAIDTPKINLQFHDIYQRYPDAKEIRLGMFNDLAVYRIKQNNQLMMISAKNGKQLSPISKQQALLIANSEYTGSGEVVAANFITEVAPFELSARHLPAWQISFDDFTAPTLYVSANSGLVVTKRHDLWRLFDWMFRFHVMDYQDSEIDNTLLFITALLALIATISGAVLVYFRVVVPVRKRQQS